MSVRRAMILTISFLLGLAATAAAQTAYVGASLLGDIVRTGHTESAGFDSDSGSGDAVGFALRIGTGMGSNWGVELEYARPSMIKSSRQVVYPLFSSALVGTPQGALQELVATLPTIYPPQYPFPVAIETRERHITISTVLWTNQHVSERVDLVFLGGVAFERFDQESGYGFGADVIPFFSSRTIAYGARPVVGLESWVGLTEHVTLMPGIRLLGVQNGWSIRPAVGLGWSF